MDCRSITVTSNLNHWRMHSMSWGWRKQRTLVDKTPPKPPFYLASEDLFVKKDGKEIFVKHIHSVSRKISNRGPVIMSPGVCSNANLFRMDESGGCLSLDHDRSFANLLASEGFHVYLYHPGFTERVHNRYVSRHCNESIHYRKRYKVSAEFGYRDMVDFEVPAVIDFVCRHSGKRNVDWIGYSLGGMIAYSFLSKNRTNPIRNLITIGAPMTLNQLFFRFVPFINFASTSLGLEEDALLGNIAHNLVPLTRGIRALPNWIVRFNLVTPLLCNPLNITNTAIKTILGQIIEPMPKELERFFSRFVQQGYSSREKFVVYLKNLRQLKKTRRRFLFFYGANDMIATAESVFLARETISPGDPDNLIGVPAAGHIDLVLGKNAFEKVWKPSLEWLKKNG
ncbi:MAG: alpha/beta fold hydrolase [Thermodesulfobacteriota bacterium]